MLPTSSLRFASALAGKGPDVSAGTEIRKQSPGRSRLDPVPGGGGRSPRCPALPVLKTQDEGRSVSLETGVRRLGGASGGSALTADAPPARASDPRTEKGARPPLLSERLCRRLQRSLRLQR